MYKFFRFMALIAAIALVVCAFLKPLRLGFITDQCW